MHKLLLFLAGLIFMGFSSGVFAETCAQETEGRQTCISGEMMKCAKKFDSSIKAFKYAWDAINASGQSFDVNSPLYKKVPGYTPASCSGSSVAKK